MANFREYTSGRDRVSNRPARPVELITVTFAVVDGSAAPDRSYDPKDSLFPLAGQTIETLDGQVLTVASTVSGGTAPYVGLEKDTGPDRARVN